MAHCASTTPTHKLFAAMERWRYRLILRSALLVVPIKLRADWKGTTLRLPCASMLPRDWGQFNAILELTIFTTLQIRASRKHRHKLNSVQSMQQRLRSLEQNILWNSYWKPWPFAKTFRWLAKVCAGKVCIMVLKINLQIWDTKAFK